MTETEIMKALECCSKPVSESCVDCPLYKSDCLKVSIEELALDLINRKNAEINRLTAVEEAHHAQNGELRTEVERLNFENLQMLASIKGLKVEAIKEFVEKIYRSCAMYGQKDKFNKTVFLNIVARIAKEMGVEL